MLPYLPSRYQNDTGAGKSAPPPSPLVGRMLTGPTIHLGSQNALSLASTRHERLSFHLRRLSSKHKGDIAPTPLRAFPAGRAKVAKHRKRAIIKKITLQCPQEISFLPHKEEKRVFVRYRNTRAARPRATARQAMCHKSDASS